MNRTSIEVRKPLRLVNQSWGALTRYQEKLPSSNRVFREFSSEINQKARAQRALLLGLATINICFSMGAQAKEESSSGATSSVANSSISSTSASGLGISSSSVASGSGSVLNPAEKQKENVEIDPVTGRVLQKTEGQNQIWRPSAILSGSVYSTVNRAQPELTRTGSLMALASLSHNPTGLQGRALINRSQNFTYSDDMGRSSEWSDLTMGLGKSFQIPYFDALLVRLNGIVPMNYYSKRASLKGGVGVTSVFVKNLGRWSLTPVFNYTRRMYEYDMDKGGVINSPDSYYGQLALSYQAAEKIILSANAGVGMLRSFQGVNRGTSEFGLSGTYLAAEKVSVNVGAATYSGTLSSDGQRTRIRVYDADSTQIYAGLSLSL